MAYKLNLNGDGTTSLKSKFKLFFATNGDAPMGLKCEKSVRTDSVCSKNVQPRIIKDVVLAPIILMRLPC